MKAAATKRQRALVCAWLGACLIALLVWITGFVQPAGHWYSDCPNLQSQTDAFARGSISLGNNVYNLRWDQAWSDGAQQVWGLGVPAWRYIVQALAMIFSGDVFPDRITFLIAHFLCATFLAWTLLPQHDDTTERLWKTVRSVCVLALLMVAAPFLTLLKTRFYDYEEVVAYGYLHVLVLFALLLRAAQRPSMSRMLLLSAWAGIGLFIRPTLLFYGAATGVLAIALAWPARRRWRIILGMVLVYGGFVSLLCWSNYVRFGGIAEFGHSLNVQDDPALNHNTFALKFGYPFRTEPLWSAAREEIGTLFFVKNLNGGKFYQQGTIAGESPTYRWREMYFTVFDSLYLFLFVLSAAMWGRNWRRIRAAWTQYTANARAGSGLAQGLDSATMLLATPWALGAFVGLFAFYLRSPSMASRYTVDFLAAIMVAVAALIWNRLEFTPPNRRPVWTVFISVGVASWLVYELLTAKIEPAYQGKALNLDEIEERRPQTTSIELTTPLRRYEIEVPAPTERIRFNCAGWNLTNGTVDASVLLFATDPQCVILSLFKPRGETIRHDELNPIQAKIGLEFLARESVEVRSNRATIVFQGPQRQSYQKGLQICFLGFVRAKDLGRTTPAVRLSSVSFERPTNPEATGVDQDANDRKQLSSGTTR